MNKKNLAYFILFLVVMCVFVVACNPAPGEMGQEEQGSITQRKVVYNYGMEMVYEIPIYNGKLKSGAVCYVYTGYNKGGISCISR